MHPSRRQFSILSFRFHVDHVALVTSKCTDVTAFTDVIEIDRALGLFQFVAFDMLSLVRLWVLIVLLTR